MDEFVHKPNPRPQEETLDPTELSGEQSAHLVPEEISQPESELVSPSAVPFANDALPSSDVLPPSASDILPSASVNVMPTMSVNERSRVTIPMEEKTIPMEEALSDATVFFDGNAEDLPAKDFAKEEPPASTFAPSNGVSNTVPNGASNMVGTSNIASNVVSNTVDAGTSEGTTCVVMLPGMTFDSFRVLERIGRGGMGEIWKAQDLEGDRIVAIKLVPCGIQEYEEELQRVREMFRRVHELQHQNIGPIYSMKHHPQVGDYLVMKYIQGETLDAYRQRFPAVVLTPTAVASVTNGSVLPPSVLPPSASASLGGSSLVETPITEAIHRVPLCKTLEILTPIADALDYAHRFGILHRDIKPGNILVRVRYASETTAIHAADSASLTTTASVLGDSSLTSTSKLVPDVSCEFEPKQGTIVHSNEPFPASQEDTILDVQLIDFGLAMNLRTDLSHPLQMAGTRLYMAPEQWNAEVLDARTDQYALAVVLYEMLSGRLPFIGKTPSELRQHVLNNAPTPIPGYLPLVSSVIFRALAKKRADRYATCREFLDTLQQALQIQHSTPHPALVMPGYSVSTVNASTLPNTMPDTVPNVLSPTLVTDDATQSSSAANATKHRRRRWWNIGSAILFMTFGAWLAAHFQNTTPTSSPEESVAIYRGHVDTVYSVRISPDGKTFFTASNDGDIVQQDYETGKILRTYTGAERGIIELAISPDGQTLAGAVLDGTALLWNVQSTEILHKLVDTSTSVFNDITFNTDGTAVLTAAGDGVVTLWDASTGEELRHFEDPERDSIRSVACDCEGRYLLTGDTDGDVVLWDYMTAEPIRQYQHHSEAVTAVAFSPDCRQLVGVSEDSLAVLWNIDSVQPIKVFKGASSDLFAVTFDHSGRRILAGSKDGTALLWNISTNRIVHRFVGHEGTIWSVAITPDDQYCFTAGGDSTTRKWKMPPL